MRATFEEILSLQQRYSPLNTPDMQRRGVLIRDHLPSEIREELEALSVTLAPFGDDLKVNGRDATGRKSLVPWVRIFSQRMSPKPGSGWYLVYLFHPDASGVSLCLSHGSTSPVDGGYQRHKKEEIAQLMGWAQHVLDQDRVVNPMTRSGVALGKGKLSSAYEKTTILSRFYATGQVPVDAELRADRLIFAGQLRKLYMAQEARLALDSAWANDRQTSAPVIGELEYSLISSIPSAVAEPPVPLSPEDARQRIETLIFVRQGGGAFRNEALKRFNGRCAISDWDVPQVLEAAHIVPYRGEHTNTHDNALLLRADLHTLFDCDLLKIDPDTLSVRLSDTLSSGPYAAFSGKEIARPAGVTREALRTRLLERIEAMKPKAF